MLPSTLILRCGCTFTANMPDNATGALYGIQSPFNVEDKYHITLQRISQAPPTFLEADDDKKPEWARHCHHMIAFDITSFSQANWKGFPVFEEIRERFGAMVPQCWLPDILNGRGRFYGLWQFQTDARWKSAKGGFRVLDGGETKVEGPEAS